MEDELSSAEEALAQVDRVDRDVRTVGATLSMTLVWMYGALLLAGVPVLFIAGGWELAMLPLLAGIALSPKAVRAIHRSRSLASETRQDLLLPQKAEGTADAKEASKRSSGG